MVRREQSRASCHDSVAVVIRVAREGDIEAVPQGYEPLHGKRGRGVHSDLAVPIHGHKSKGRINVAVDDGEVQPVALGNKRPTMDAGATQRINANVELGRANGVHVEHVREVIYIGIEIVVPVRRLGAERFLDWNPFDSRKPFLKKLVGFRLDPISYGLFRRAASGWIVFEAAVMRWIVRRGYNDAIREPGLSPAVVRKNRMGDNGSGRVFLSSSDHHLHAVGRQHLQRGGKRGNGERVGVHA